MTNTILDTSLTIEFIVQKLWEYEDKDCFKIENLASYKVENDTNPAFMSRIVRVFLKWNTSTGIDTVLLKIPGFQNPGKQEDTSQVDLFLPQAHTKECEFYSYFTKLNDLNLKLPKYYYGHHYSLLHNHGAIIMEDLSKSAKTDNMFPGFTNEQVEAVVVELAKLSAASWKNPGWIQKVGRRIKGAEHFILEYRMEPLFQPDSLDKVSYVEEPYPSGIPPACLHSDLWSANILWKTDPEGNPSSELAAIIDWQMAKAGNPAEDILRLLASNTTVQYRRKNYERILKLYVKTVNEIMQLEFITYEQIYKAYHESMAYESILAVFGAPLYCNMESVTGGPNSKELKEELLWRTQALVEETLNYFQL
ncbi:unnamed protein product [Bursaphelenchus okinawaensis]|uniref:CHK kinase-like domain-containing protein n=1 Tax=Bursaphelenchus okinawaensis TaxID=465554 RepID=A0A811KR57_9BILA|nr:unnamed protein product [Bursaphelenchus okinawaensis]CAG9108518.1 unnamed protein product [Bursaphelenchus okinawaensis]